MQTARSEPAGPPLQPTASRMSGVLQVAGSEPRRSPYQCGTYSFLLLPEHVFCTVANVGKEIPEVGRRLGDGLSVPEPIGAGQRFARLVAPL